MLTLKESTILSKMKEIVYIVRDSNGNIIAPENEKIVAYFNLISKGKVINQNEYYEQITDKWYQYNKEIIIDSESYTIEYFFDITKYKKREAILEKDETTKLLCKKTAFSRMNEYLEKAINENQNFAVAIGDVDFFKNVNDNYGHTCGDVVLEEIGNIILTHTRQRTGRNADVVGRIGGEEFLILLQNINRENAIKRIEQIRNIIENIKIEYDNRIINDITMSFGLLWVNISNYLKFENIEDLRCEILKKCDKALYVGKENGRNIVVEYENSKVLTLK